MAGVNRPLDRFSPKVGLVIMHILIVEDEEKLANAVRKGLEAEGYSVSVAFTGEEGFFLISNQSYDLLILDVMLPGRDGVEILTAVRKRGLSVPVLFLTAKDSIEDRVRGLDAGADDYLVKPFSTEELLARVRALLRRFQKQGKSPAKLKLGDVEIDLARQTALRGKKSIHLTAKEFSMLRLMAESPGEPVSRERFLDVVWGYAAFPTTRTVDNHIASLRGKIERDPDSPKWIKTVHGVGYRLEENK